jgi:hypothetical protein
MLETRRIHASLIFPTKATPIKWGRCELSTNCFKTRSELSTPWHQGVAWGWLSAKVVAPWWPSQGAKKNKILIIDFFSRENTVQKKVTVDSETQSHGTKIEIIAIHRRWEVEIEWKEFPSKR